MMIPQKSANKTSYTSRNANNCPAKLPSVEDDILKDFWERVEENIQQRAAGGTEPGLSTSRSNLFSQGTDCNLSWHTKDFSFHHAITE